MELLKLENFRLIDRNKAGAKAYLKYEGGTATADYIFYLQADQCLSIRLGRHDNSVSTAEHEAYIKQEQRRIRREIQPEVSRVRQEARDRIAGLNNV